MAESHGRTATGHERSDLDFRRVAVAGLGVVLMLVLALFSLWLAGGEGGGSAPRQASTEALPAAALALQVSPAADLEALRRRNIGRLNSYGWVDRQAGIAHIPIERAMSIVVERGLPPLGRKGEPSARERHQPSPRPKREAPP